MRVTLLPSSLPNVTERPFQFLTSFLVNDTLAIDAGALGFTLPLADQDRVRHVLISHTHADHIASLPIFIETVYQAGPACVAIHASAATIASLQRDVFNGRVWPDFVNLGAPAGPFLSLHELQPGVPIELDGIRVTPVEVDHTVPTLGFLLEDSTGAVVIASDTGPTDEIWRLANRLTNLKAVFLEASFPDAMFGLAAATKHLTPATFAAEVRKLHRSPRVLAVHLKARYYDRIAAELAALAMPNVAVVEPGRAYEF